MKKLLIFLLLLTFFHEGYSQITQIGGKKSYVEVMGGFFVDSSARMPIGYTYTFTGLDSTARFWYDGPTKSIWYHNGTTRQRIANKAYVDSLVAASSGSGSVTTVTVTTANGVSGVVTNPTTTPAITLTLGAITPSSVNASGTIAGSNFSGSSSGVNTGNQTITLTGDVNGTGTGTFTTALTSIIAPASCNHCAITWDSKGRVTAATTLSVTTGTVTSITAGAGLSGGTITTSGTIALDTTKTNTWLTNQNIQVNSIATTKTIGLSLSNITTATGGVPIQYSPYFFLGGTELNTTSHVFGFRSQAKPSNADRGSLTWDVNRNGTYTNDLMSLDHTGGLTISGQLKSIGLQIIDGSSNSINILPPSSVTPYVLTLPAAQGSSNTTLINDGAGNLSWGTFQNGLSGALVDNGNGGSDVTVSCPLCTSSSIIMLTGKTSGQVGAGRWGELSVLPTTGSFTISADGDIAGLPDTRQIYYAVIKY